MDPVEQLKLLAAASSLADVAAQHTGVVMHLNLLGSSFRTSVGAMESSQLQLYAAAVGNCLELLSSAAPGQQQDVPADALSVISILCESLAGCLTQGINSVPHGEREQLGRRLAQQIWDEGVMRTLADACCMAAVALEDRKEQQQQRRQQQQAKQQPQQSAPSQQHAQQQEKAAAAKPRSAADLGFALLKLWCSVAAYLGFSGAADVDAVRQAFLKATFGPVGKLAAVVLAAWQTLSASSGGSSRRSSSSSRAGNGVDPNGVFWGYKIDQAVLEAAHAASELAVLASSAVMDGMIEQEPALQQLLLSDELLQLLAFTTAHAAHGLHAAFEGKCAVSPTGGAAVQLSMPAHHIQLLQAVGGQWVGKEGFKEQWPVEQRIGHAVVASLNAIHYRYTLFHRRSGSSSSSSSSSSSGREDGTSSSILQSSQPQQKQQAGVAPPACVVPAHLQLPWLRVLLEVALLLAATCCPLQDIPVRVLGMNETFELMALIMRVMGEEALPATWLCTAAAVGAAEGSTATASAPEAATQSGTSTAAEAPAGPAARHAAAPAAAAGATGLRLPSATAAALLAPVLRLLAPAVLHVLKQSEPGSGRGKAGGSSLADARIGIMRYYSSLLTTLCLSVEPKHLATACFNQAEPSAILVSCTMLESSLRAQAGSLRPQQQHLAWRDSIAMGQQLPLASSIARACDRPNVQGQLAAAAGVAVLTTAAGAVGMVALKNEVFALLLSSLKCAAAAVASSTDPRDDCWQIIMAASSAACQVLEGHSAARATASSGGSSSSRPGLLAAAECSAAPWLVIMARVMHVAGQLMAQLAQQFASAPGAAKLPEDVLEFVHIHIISLRLWLPLVSEEQAASGWTSASGRALGVPQLLLQQLRGRGWHLSQTLHHACPTAAVAADLGLQVQAYGAAVCAQLPLRLACNAPGCVNLSQMSEMQLVGGKGSVCGGCGEARYCGRQCQLAHWKQHKPVCQRLKGSGGGGDGGGGSG